MMFSARNVLVCKSPKATTCCEPYTCTPTRSLAVSPGFRLGWNLGERQIVIGAGVPVTRGDRHDTAVLGYFSYELPFTHK